MAQRHRARSSARGVSDATVSLQEAGRKLISSTDAQKGCSFELISSKDALGEVRLSEGLL